MLSGIPEKTRSPQSLRVPDPKKPEVKKVKPDPTRPLNLRVRVGFLHGSGPRLPTLLITTLMKMGFVSFDVGTDVTLMSQYASDFSGDDVAYYPKDCNCTKMNNSTMKESTNNTNEDNRISRLDELKISSEECFWWTLGPIILSCIFNIIEAISFLRTRGKNFSIAIKISIIIFSPLHSAPRVGHN